MEKTDSRIHREANFHDKVAEMINIDDRIVACFLKQDSPAAYLSDRLPRLRDNILKQIGDVRNKRVLVYGCGNDGTAVWFAKNGAIVDAIDISERSIKNQQYISRITNLTFKVEVRDAHKTGLPGDEYDIIYGNAILHHLNIDEARTEVYRLLKGGGLAIFREVMAGNIFLQLFRKITPFWRTPDERPLTRRDFSRLAHTFSCVRVSEYVLTQLPYLFVVKIINNCLLKKVGIIRRIPVSRPLYRFCDKVDLTLFRLLPSLRYKAWICLVVLRK